MFENTYAMRCMATLMRVLVSIQLLNEAVGAEVLNKAVSQKTLEQQTAAVAFPKDNSKD